MPPQNQANTSAPTPPPDFSQISGWQPLDEGDLQARTLGQAKAALPRPKLAAPWEEEPELNLPPTTKLGKAYAGLKSWIGDHEQHLSEKYLAPFRESLDRMGDDLVEAGESGHTKTGGQLTTPARLMVGGVGSLLKMVPVGSDVPSTVQAMATPPELGPEGKALSKELKAAQQAEKAEGTFWHGSPSGDLRGSKSGLHVGTKEAARQALEARIGIPADGKGWTGDREYGQTLLAGKKRLKELGKNETGYNVDVPEENHYAPIGKAKYSDGTPVLADAKPDVFPVRITGEMSNTPATPHEDFKANSLMAGQITRGTAKRGYFYRNVGEDEGSISAVVPGSSHLERNQKPGDETAATLDFSHIPGHVEISPAQKSGKPLPAQPRLPDRGTYAAIKTDDGAIYHDANPEKQRTHIMLANDLGIPPERVVSGGWLTNGEYEGSVRSDAGRWGEQARAKARATENRAARANEAASRETPKVETPQTHEPAGLDYAGGDKNVSIYQAHIPMEDLPSAKFVEPEEEEFDRSDYSRPRVGVPIKVAVNKDGSLEILDGNHRVKTWEEQDQQYAPAWVVDRRGPNIEQLSEAEKAERAEEAASHWDTHSATEIGKSINAKVVGSVATGKTTPDPYGVERGPKDLDLRIDGKYDAKKVEGAMREAGYEPVGSSLVSPEEAKKSGKPYGPGWNRAEHFEHPETGKKVDVWHDEPENTTPEINQEAGKALGAKPASAKSAKPVKPESKPPTGQTKPKVKPTAFRNGQPIAFEGAQT